MAALLRLKELQQGGRGYVFCAQRHRTAALAKATVTKRLQKALAGVSARPWGLYAVHLLRGEGATHAAKSGASMRVIQVLGRWKPDAVRQHMPGRRPWQHAERMLRAP